MVDRAVNTNTADTLLGYVEAYCVFQGKQIERVLGKQEFDAVIDGDQALPGVAGKVPVAYVLANQHQLIQAMVLFYLPVDEAGFSLEGWRLPLQRLADTAGRGPNLGGGRIRLACYSQCSISWHQDSLWDPVTSTFSNIKKAMAERFSASFHQSSANTSSDPELETLRRELRNESAAYRNQLQQLQQEVERQRLVNERLLNLENGAPSAAVADSNRVDLQVLRRQNQELLMKVRKLEVNNHKLREALSHQGEAEPDQSIIGKMQENEILSMVYHAGIGHLNLNPSQLQEYLQDPIAYAAHEIQLTKKQYMVWLQHQKNPKCAVCDELIPFVADAGIFDASQDIYCEQHKPVE